MSGVTHDTPSSGSRFLKVPVEPPLQQQAPPPVPKEVVAGDQSFASTKDLETAIQMLGGERKEIRIGRARSNEIRLADKSVSGRHAVIGLDKHNVLYILDGQPVDVHVTTKQLTQGDLHDIQPFDRFQVAGGFEFSLRPPSNWKLGFFQNEEDRLWKLVANLAQGESLTIGHKTDADFRFAERKDAQPFLFVISKHFGDRIVIDTVEPSKNGVKVRRNGYDHYVEGSCKLKPGDWVSLGPDTHFMIPYKDSLSPKIVRYHGSRQKGDALGLLPSNFIPATEPNAAEILKFAEYISKGLELLNAGKAKEAQLYFYNHDPLEIFGVLVDETQEISIDPMYESKLRSVLRDFHVRNIFVPKSDQENQAAKLLKIVQNQSKPLDPNQTEPNQDLMNNFYHEVAIATIANVWLPALRAKLGRPLCEFGCYAGVEETPQLDAYITLLQQHVLFSDLSSLHIAYHPRYQSLKFVTPDEDSTAVSKQIRDLVPGLESFIGTQGDIKIDPVKYPLISRKHLSISLEQNGSEICYKICDNNSKNGTQIQRAGDDWMQLAPGQPEYVKPGDKIRLPNFEFTV